METIERRYTYEYFYLMGVLLVLLFSVCVNARVHESFVSAAVPTHHVQELEPVLTRDVAYCPADARLNNGSTHAICQKEDHSWFTTNVDAPTWKFKTGILGELKERGTKYAE